MTILLDTHIALWSLYDDRRLSERSRAFLEFSGNEICYSLVSAWEIGIKNSLGKLAVPADSFIRDCDRMGYQVLEIRKEHIVGLKELSFPENGHKDPFDRLLLTQAKIEGVCFLTQDAKLLAYDEPCIL